MTPASPPPSQPELPTTMQPVQSRPVVKRAAASWYIAGFVSMQLLLLLSTFVIPTSQWFLWHDHYPALRNIGYSQRIGHQDCQIVIYGDSSSLTGLNPGIIQSMTGLKACNVSEGLTIQEVVGSDVPLQAYLQHNAPPRFLVGTWTPSGLRPEIPPLENYTPEGAVYAMQFGKRKQLLRFLTRHPRLMVTYTVWVLQSLAGGIVDEFTGKARHQIDARSQRDARKGQWPYPNTPETRCVRTDVHINPELIGRHEASVAAFRRKYTTPVTTVVIDMSPVPTCDQLYDVYARQAEGLHENSFDRVPISYFNEGDVHFSEQGSHYFSEQVGRQIVDLMKEQGTVSSRAEETVTPQ